MKGYECNVVIQKTFHRKERKTERYDLGEHGDGTSKNNNFMSKRKKY